MKKIFYRKLIRDNIPKIIKAGGSQYSVQTLSAKSFERELIKKVGEEASGMVAARSRTKLIAELADVVDVLEEIKRVKKISTREVSAAQRANLKRKGGFKKRLFLRWSSNDRYKSNERRG